MTDTQKQEMFEEALHRTVFNFQLKLPEAMRDRWLTSTFAHHMMKAEGRKQIYFTSPALHRWVNRHQSELNEAFTEFRAFVRDWIAAGEAQEIEELLARTTYTN